MSERRLVVSRCAVVVVGLVLLLLVGARAARADVNTASIAVPLLGTQGAAAPYPSSQTVVARGGATHTSIVRIVLRQVTHPCPEDLAVLLVHGAEKYLLMSNAGGCRALEGTDIQFNPFSSAFPDTQPATPAYSSSVTVGPSNYGAVPVFPAPAPAGPYLTTLPPLGTNVNGTWDLYVMDTTANNRGVIAGGWSLVYDTDAMVNSSQTLVNIPLNGPALVYPITFDLTTVPVGVPATTVTIDIVLRHTWPDDLRIVLQSPSGTAVALMANAGGGNDLLPGTVLTFDDDAPASLPDNTVINAGSYKPTVYAPGPMIPAPGPTSGYATTMAAFIGEAIRGTWKLWVYDDAGPDSGQIQSAYLTIETEVPPAPVLMPTPGTTNQPFVRIQGTEGAGSALISPYDAAWRVTNGTFYDAGTFQFTPGTNVFSGEVPLKKGTNSILFRTRNTMGASYTSGTAVVVNEFTYSFAEGATGSFFDFDLTLANPAATDAPIAIDFLPEGGSPIPYSNTISANTPLQLSVDSILPAAALSSVVHSTNGVPLAAERTMIWDATGYGGHGGTAVAPATRWLFAEGSQGYFNTFVLLANDNAAAVNVTVKFLIEGGGVVNVPIVIPGKTRHTLFAGDVAQLVDQSFGIDITATAPIIAERAMYLPGARLFEGGHESAGVNEPSKQWFLAEGATGSFFDCFVLIGNPNSSPANVNLSYLLPSGTTITKSIVVPANSRVTINVETEDAQLANADVSTTVTSDIGIVVERAMYWPNISEGWREAHNSFGVTSSALRWGVADGRIGGPRGFQTFILLANPNPYPAEVQVRFLKSAFTVTRTYTLNPSSRHSIYANVDTPELGEGTFSADVQVLNYQPIAVEKALYGNSGAETFAGGTNVTATRLPPP